MIKSRLRLSLCLALHIIRTHNQKKGHFPSPRWILGHRGARSESPENTLAAFRLAMEQGADGVEFDVSLSKDGLPVVIHDERVSRTTNGVGKVKDLTAEELAKLDASKPIPGYPKQGIPTLKQTLISLPNNAIANVELKFSGNFDKQFFIEAVMNILVEHKQRLRLIVSSFDGELLSMLRCRAPNLLISLILSTRDEHWPSSLTYFSSINPEGLHLSADLLSPSILMLIRKAKLGVATWTINDKKTAKQLWALGVDGIFTDQVAKIVKAIRYSSS